MQGRNPWRIQAGIIADASGPPTRLCYISRSSQSYGAIREFIHHVHRPYSWHKVVLADLTRRPSKLLRMPTMFSPIRPAEQNTIPCSNLDPQVHLPMMAHQSLSRKRRLRASLIISPSTSKTLLGRLGRIVRQTEQGGHDLTPMESLGMSSRRCKWIASMNR